MKQEESFINTVEALLSGACVCKAPAIELIRSGLQHTLIMGANQPTAVRTESKGKTCTQRSGKGQMPRTDGNQPNSKLQSRSLSWLVVSFVSEQKPSWQGFVTLTRDGSNSTQGWNSWQSEATGVDVTKLRELARKTGLDGFKPLTSN